MLRTIQIKLIHSLGGYTKEQYRIPSLSTYTKGLDKGFIQGYKLGYRKLAKELHDTATDIYPCSQQEWIDIIWNEINKVYQNNVK